LVEHFLAKEDVESSSLFARSKQIAAVAHQVEQQTENLCVAGSSPARGTNQCVFSSVGIEHWFTKPGAGSSSLSGRTIPGDIAQLVVRLLHTEMVTGSSPVITTILLFFCNTVLDNNCQVPYNRSLVRHCANTTGSLKIYKRGSWRAALGAVHL
jgi:hypothetical protein